jgi:putative transposase
MSFPTIITDCFVIMPNHIHGIFFIMEDCHDVGATFEVAHRAGSSPASTVGRIIDVFKSVCVRRWALCLAQNDVNLEEIFWQRNYCDHIIWNERELNTVREYILLNPSKWLFDNENPNSIIDPDYVK